MRKLYVASYEMQVLFTADEEIENVDQIGAKAVEEDLRNTMAEVLPEDIICNVLKPARAIGSSEVDKNKLPCLPGNWEKDSLCYGSHEGDLTVEKAWEMFNKEQS